MEKDKRLLCLGERIRDIRIAKGLSQYQLAHSIGKDQPSINRVERGHINPSYIYLLELCSGLGIHTFELHMPELMEELKKKQDAAINLEMQNQAKLNVLIEMQSRIIAHLEGESQQSIADHYDNRYKSNLKAVQTSTLNNL